jgi:predicted nucleic acid-binding protein
VITAIDTSVLLDVFKADPTFGLRSKELLRRCIGEGRLIACEVVFAEVGGAFTNGEKAREAMQLLGVEYEPICLEAAAIAGEAFRAYHLRGGKRERVVADFLVASHALHHADRLLTRDRGFHRTYFSTLRVLDPSAPE